MTTLTDLKAASNGILETFVDKEQLPDGHFGAMGLINNDLVGYLLAGEQDDPEAVVKGRVEYAKADGKLAVYGFAGPGLNGGTPLGLITDYRETFAQMV
jgi:hypothetical protein